MPARRAAEALRLPDARRETSYVDYVEHDEGVEAPASCADRIILVSEALLRRAVHEFADHYHHERNQQGLGNRLIAPLAEQANHEGHVAWPLGSPIPTSIPDPTFPGADHGPIVGQCDVGIDG